MVGAGGLIAVLVIGSFALSGIRGGTSTGASGRGGRVNVVEGVGTPVETAEASHVAEGQPVSYNSTPPTSGAHWPAWAACGVYDTELPDERIVHNLEHGHVVISHNLTDPSELNRLVELTDELKEFELWGVLRRYSKIDPGSVGLSAWSVTDLSPGVDEERIKRFYDNYHRNQFSEETRGLGRAIACDSDVRANGHVPG